MTMSYRIGPEEWDADRRRLIMPRNRDERKRQLIDYERCMAADLWRMGRVVMALENRGDYTIDDIMYHYRLLMSGNTLKIYAEKLAVELEESGHGRTARAYRSAVTRFVQFNRGEDILLENITAGVVNAFQQAMESEGKSLNTQSFYMRTLRAICNKAIEEGRMVRRSESPFAEVYTGVSPTSKLSLTQEELRLLIQFDPTMTGTKRTEQSKKLSQSLQQALAIFLFCFHARGMGFVDMAHLKKSDLRRDILRYRRRKTGQVIEVKMLPPMRRIVDYFAPLTAGSEYLFPIITDPHKDLRLQYESGLTLQNHRLKKLAAAVGIHKQLSTHCARHSWAAVAKGKKLPLPVISGGLGDISPQKTAIYLASLEQSVLDRASQLVSGAIDATSISNGN